MNPQLDAFLEEVRDDIAGGLVEATADRIDAELAKHDSALVRGVGGVLARAFRTEGPEGVQLAFNSIEALLERRVDPAALQHLRHDPDALSALVTAAQDAEAAQIAEVAAWARKLRAYLVAVGRFAARAAVG